MRASLLLAIQTELRNIGASSPALAHRARTDKIFEVFVWSCMLRALRELGATLEARDHADAPTTLLDFRLAPGLLYNPTTTPGFVLVSYEGSEYEVHCGLRVLGSSKVLHELDVCILERSHARRCRTQRIDPDSSGVKFLAECKYYGRAIPLHLGREFLGLGSEFSIRVETIVANQGSPDVHRLVKRHRGTSQFNLTTANPAKIARFIGWLSTELEHVL